MSEALLPHDDPAALRRLVDEEERRRQQFDDAVERKQVSKREQAEESARRTRFDTALANRRKGKPYAPPGSTFHVSTAKGIKTRSRRGLRFEATQRAKVEVLDKSDDEIDELVKTGAYVTNPAGMELMFEDDGLFVSADADAGDLVSARQRADAAEAALAAAQAELAQLKSDARKNAPDPNDGTPGRLKAAAKVDKPKDDEKK